jgi:hypothetical protein
VDRPGDGRGDRHLAALGPADLGGARLAAAPRQALQAAREDYRVDVVRAGDQCGGCEMHHCSRAVLPEHLVQAGRVQNIADP